MRDASTLACLLAFCTMPAVAQTASNNTKTTTPTKTVSPGATMPLLNYAFKVGETRKYRVTGLFHGQFPPFASPGAPPVNLRIVLDYVANVKKQDKDTAEIAFHIERADLFLLEAEPDKDGRLPPGKEEVNFPIPVEDIQKSLDVTATLKPDGTVSNITGGNASSAKINFGIELRKLFLLIFPVAFTGSDATGSTWKTEDGLLGKAPGLISYETRLSGKTAKTLTLKQTGVSKINDMKDENNNSVTEMAKAATLNTGEASYEGTLIYATQTGGDKTRVATGQLLSANLNLVAKVHTKITKPDPKKPEEPTETDVDVTARFKVEPLKDAKDLIVSPTVKKATPQVEVRHSQVRPKKATKKP